MLRPGTFLGNRYEVGERIGSGGMSDVYKAMDHKLSRSVAIKVLKPDFNSDRAFVQKFRQEAQAAASLQHQNIVNVYDVGYEDDIHYIVMELIDGITLKRYIEKKGRLTSRETIGITIQVAQGIEVAHGEHIVHRDIKPQNVIISRDGKVKVTDFGIARAVSAHTISSNAIGSVHYISPEQARGGYCDERSDIYSLGVTMYEMITGHVPYDGESTVEIALKHIQGEAMAPSEYAPDIYLSLERIIEKCMQKKPEYRYATVTALIADLKRSLVSPDEDFVKIAPVPASRPTRVISEDEINEINAAAQAEEEKAYLRGDEPEEPEDDEDYPYEDGDEILPLTEEDDSGRRFEKIMIAVGIGVGVLIIILVIFVVGNILGLFGKSEETESETESQSIETAFEMDMPDLVGLSYEEAVEVLEQNRLDYTVEQAQDDQYGEGEVVDTDPAAGDTVRSDQTVVLYVNSLAVEIPEGQIVGFTRTAATEALHTMGLVVTVEEEYSDEVDQGYVISVDPGEGSTVMLGDTVTLTVSLGEESHPVVVPSVVGQSSDTASATLRGEGFQVNILEESSSSVANGRVIRQTPSSGSQLEEGSTVTIYVSTGEETVEVPNVVGQTVEQAQQTLNSAGLTSQISSTEYSDSVAQDHVISQTPSSGSVTVGTAISLVVSQGPEPTEAPSEPSGGDTGSGDSGNDTGDTGNDTGDTGNDTGDSGDAGNDTGGGDAGENAEA